MHAASAPTKYGIAPVTCSSDRRDRLKHSVHGVSRGRPFRSAVGQAFDPMPWQDAWPPPHRSEEHTSELQSLMRISYAVFCLKKKNNLRIISAVLVMQRYIAHNTLRNVIQH